MMFNPYTYVHNTHFILVFTNKVMSAEYTIVIFHPSAKFYLLSIKMFTY